jgi:hypothetical protein
MNLRTHIGFYIYSGDTVLALADVSMTLRDSGIAQAFTMTSSTWHSVGTLSIYSTKSGISCTWLRAYAVYSRDRI